MTVFCTDVCGCRMMSCLIWRRSRSVLKCNVWLSKSRRRCLLLDARNSLRIKLATLVGRSAWTPKQPLLAWILEDYSVELQTAAPQADGKKWHYAEKLQNPELEFREEYVISGGLLEVRSVAQCTTWPLGLAWKGGPRCSSWSRDLNSSDIPHCHRWSHTD